jgi:hypothetical protein
MGLINLFKKPKVEFLCTHPGALETYPIVPMRKARPKWLELSLREFIADKSNGHPEKSIARCPGITKLYKTGWMVYAWQDIVVNIGPKGEYEWEAKIDESVIRPGSAVVMGNHLGDTFKHSEFLSKKVPILKLQLPWAVKIPEGYNMMQLPVPYQEHDKFTTATGVYERVFGYFELNLQLMCRGGVDRFVIEAGTPLAHLILIKDETVPSVARYATQDEVEEMLTITVVKASRHMINYTNLKKAIAQIFGKGQKCPFHLGK